MEAELALFLPPHSVHSTKLLLGSQTGACLPLRVSPPKLTWGLLVDRIKGNPVYVFSHSMCPMCSTSYSRAVILVRMKQHSPFGESEDINNLNAIQRYCFKLGCPDRLDKGEVEQVITSYLILQQSGKDFRVPL